MNIQSKPTPISSNKLNTFRQLTIPLTFRQWKLIKEYEGSSNNNPGDADVLHLANRPEPMPLAHEVLVEVKAAGVNRPDIAQRKGHYPPPPWTSQDIPGLEIAGTVVSLGDDSSRWKVGDKVCALVSGGGYAEYCAVPEGQCLPIPSNLSFVEAASLPETFFTIWSNVFDRGKLKKG